jgi:UDP-N-acetylmuramyl pentapeptide phosphotransferase/UDP-N-acetylglucosamine-1-phosphate transferase
MDLPNERSLHTNPTPRSGGIAILVSVLASLGLAAIGFAFASTPQGFLPKGLASSSVWIVGSITLVTTVSLIDDRRGLPAGVRLVVQTIAAVVIIWGVGLVVSSFTVPDVVTVPLKWLAGPVSLLFLLWMTNLYNFMDGMDGFAGGMTVIGFGFLAYFGWLTGHPTMLYITTAVSASAIGFLFHNFPPARIFMGDVGSIPLGFTAGTIVLLGIRDGLFDVWVPTLIFSPFILDATVTVARRAWRGERVWQAHREHYYQRLVLSGWSHRRTVLAEYVMMVSCGCLAILYHAVGEAWRLAILAVWMLLFLVLASAVRAREQHVEHAGR